MPPSGWQRWSGNWQEKGQKHERGCGDQTVDLAIGQYVAGRISGSRHAQCTDVVLDHKVVDIEPILKGAVVELFDSEYSLGNRTSGWYQAKARYFNDIIVALLSNASKRAIALRSKKRSQLFRLIDIDICCQKDK